MGYQTVSGLSSGQFKAFAVQFENVAGGEIAVKDLVTVGTPAGNGVFNFSADQIWRWDTEAATWTKYYYRANREGVVGWCKSDEKTETADTIPAGETFFFRRGTGAGATDLTLAGSVKAFEGSSQYAASSGQFVFMANPWPVATAIKDFASYQTSPAGNGVFNFSADQIWRWDTEAATWTKYYYRANREGVVGWCKSDEKTETADTIPAGEGFFFRRATGQGEDMITFTAPTAE